MSLFTLGHSTLEPDEFVAAARGIDVIVDVRSHPGSKRVPHFSKDWMRNWLPEMGLQYEWRPGLGGWDSRHDSMSSKFWEVGVDVHAYAQGFFPRQRIGVDRQGGENGATWTNQGLYDYAWFTSIPEFLEGADRLSQDYGSERGPNAAIVCAEAMWWKCHRSMIADYLTWSGIWVAHLPIKPPKRETTPRYRPHYQVIGNRLERYPRPVMEAWKEHRDRS